MPLPLVVIILAQAIGVTWWASGEFRDVNARLAALEAVDDLRRSHEARIIVLEQASIRITDDLSEIKALLRNGKGASLNSPAR